MKIGVSLKVNVAKIDKARLFQGKNGNVYLDATVFIDVDQLDQYGNSGMITQDVKKEEKAQGVKGNILGNCKVFWNDAGQAPQQQAQQVPQYQQQAPQQQPQQRPMDQAMAQNGINPQQINPQAPVDDLGDDLPF